MNRVTKQIPEEKIQGYIQELKDCGGGEEGHSIADSIICEIISELGFEDVVEAYGNVSPKWYA